MGTYFTYFIDVYRSHTQYRRLHNVGHCCLVRIGKTMMALREKKPFDFIIVANATNRKWKLQLLLAGNSQNNNQNVYRNVMS